MCIGEYARVYIFTFSIHTHCTLHKTISTLIMCNVVWYFIYFSHWKNTRLSGAVWEQNARLCPLPNTGSQCAQRAVCLHDTDVLLSFLALSPAASMAFPGLPEKQTLSYAVCYVRQRSCHTAIICWGDYLPPDCEHWGFKQHTLFVSDSSGPCKGTGRELEPNSTGF